MQQGTPKHAAGMARSDFVSKNQMYHSASLSGFVKKEEKKEEKNFLDNLNNYLDSLNETADHFSHIPGPDRLTETLKYPLQDSYTMASKL
jgi:hypothetical protein